MSESLGIAKKRLIKEIVENTWKVDPTKKTFNLLELMYVVQELSDDEGKKYFEKKSTFRGHIVFRNFAKLMLYRNCANYDSMVLLTADKGTGKSSAAIMLAREWCRLIGIKFNPDRHMAYSNADLMNKIDVLNKFEPIIADEAIRFASSTDWAKAENKELKKKLAQVRTKHLLYILCFPLKVGKVEKTYLESFVNYWVDLYGRGIGAIFVKDKNPVNDAWRMTDFKKIGSYNEFTSPVEVEKRLKNHPNYWTSIKFPKPPKWLYDKYLKVREKNIYDEDAIMGTVAKEDIWRALLILALRDLMRNDETLSMNRIILHLRNEYDIHITKKMVEDSVNDANQLIDKVRQENLVQ